MGIPLLEASGTSTDGTIAATSDMETTTTSDSTATEATSNDATTSNATTNETAKASEDSVIIDPNGIGTEAATATASEDSVISPMCIEAMSKDSVIGIGTEATTAKPPTRRAEATTLQAKPDRGSPSLRRGTQHQQLIDSHHVEWWRWWQRWWRSQARSSDDSQRFSGEIHA